MSPSIADAAVGLMQQLSWLKAELPVRELRFAEPRRWRFDMAWPGRMLALEVEGGIWLKGGHHTSGKGFQSDIEKYNEATLRGWRLLRVTPKMIDDGTAVQLIERALRTWDRSEIPDFGQQIVKMSR